MKGENRPYALLLGFILITGLLLRFWNFWNLPFTYDELSALSRTTFSTFSEMIRMGVVRDSHPAGIQAFLYYWVRFLGDSEILVKLPFLLAGLASIWLSYLIGVLWFNRSVGILSAAYLSSLQLFVLYSQVARPYVTGLLLSLAMTWFWSRYFRKGNKLKDLLLFTLFGAMAAYNHYFSLLFLATLGLTGFFFTDRKNILPYLLSGTAMFILYLPHLPIFLAQAEKGTIGGWLGEPGRWFLAEYFSWLFHYSVVTIVFFILVILIGMFTGQKTREHPPAAGKKRAVLLLWLLPAPVFGYIYSYAVEPILQFSLFIFTAPYFFLLVFSWIRELPVRRLAIIVMLVLAVNIFSLTVHRQHYLILYKQPFEEVVRMAVRLNQQYPGGVFIISGYSPYYSEYYFRKYGKSLPYFTNSNKGLDDEELDSVYRSITNRQVITSGLPPDHFHLVKRHFPYWTGYDAGFTFEQYIFSREQPTGSLLIEPATIDKTEFGDVPTRWKFDSGAVVNDTLQDSQSYDMSGREWGPLIELPLDSITTSGYVFIDFNLKLHASVPVEKIVLVGEIYEGTSQLAWKGKPLEVPPGTYEVATALDIQVMLKNEMKTKGRTLKVYLWNPHKAAFAVRSMWISKRAGNPYRYALFSDFKKTAVKVDP